MGSFNVSCSLSGKSISGKVVFLPLVKNHIYKHETDTDDFVMSPSSYICENSDTHPLCPATLPIMGEYYDYGDITVTSSPLDEYFEQAYGVDCQHYIESTIHHQEGTVCSESLFGLYIDGIIWDEMLKSYDKLNTIDNDLWPTPYELEKLGFIYIGEVDVDRYDSLYQHPAFPDSVAIGSDGHFLQSLKREDDKWVLTNHPLYKVKDLKSWVSKNILPNQQIDFSVLGSSLRIARVKAHVAEVLSSLTRLGTFFASGENSQEYIKNHHNFRWLFAGYNNQHIAKLCLQPLLSGDEYIIEKVSELYAMHDIFMSCGRIFLPTYIGPQCGEPKYTLALGRALVKSSKEMIKSRED